MYRFNVGNTNSDDHSFMIYSLNPVKRDFGSLELFLMKVQNCLGITGWWNAKGYHYDHSRGQLGIARVIFV